MCSYILTNHDVSFWNAGLMSKFSGRINCWTKAIFSESWSSIFASSGIEANTRANNFVMTYFSRPCIWSKPRGKAISKYRKHYIVMEFYQEKNAKQSFLSNKVRRWRTNIQFSSWKNSCRIPEKPHALLRLI